MSFHEQIDCCLLIGIFKRSQESLWDGVKELLDDNRAEINDFAIEIIKDFVGGSQKQIELIFWSLKKRNLLCQNCVDFDINFKEEIESRMDSLILAEEIREKLQLELRRVKPLQENRIFEVTIHLENVSENDKKEVAKQIEEAIPREHNGHPIFIESMWTRLVPRRTLELEDKLKKAEDKLRQSRLKK